MKGSSTMPVRCLSLSCSSDSFIPIKASPFPIYQKKVDHMQMGPVSATRRERKYSSCSISIENHLGTWLVAVGYENTSHALWLTHRGKYTSIFSTHYSEKIYKPDVGNMILIYSRTCHADNRCIWIWKQSYHYWYTHIQTFHAQTESDMHCNQELNLHVWNTSILVKVEIFPIW